MNFETVFVIKPHVVGLSGSLTLDILMLNAVGLAGWATYLICQLILSRNASSETKQKALRIAILAVGFSIVTFPSAFETRRHSDALVKAYLDGSFFVTEGVVKVLHTQPYNGHSKGDIMEINGKEFEIDYFRTTGGYQKTISHGGALREGAYVKVYHRNGVVLRVDVQGGPVKSPLALEETSIGQFLVKYRLVLVILGLLDLGFVFLTFDRLVKWQHEHHREEWEKDGKPDGFFWMPTARKSWRGHLAMTKLNVLWLFRTPPWARSGSPSRRWFIQFRIAVLAWWVIALIFFCFKGDGI